MNHISLFNGIGGFQLAAEWVGWNNMASCEIDQFCNKVTKYHFPNCIQHEDISTTDFTIYRGQCGILTGGFPCQPYSQAGKRKGKEDERHLWPEMLRAIREIRPRWVVGENVFGLINWNGGMVFDEVQADLEAAGYEVWPYVLPACGVNAPHRRDRVWFIAHTKGERMHREEGNFCEANGRQISGLLSEFDKSDNRYAQSRAITNANGYGQYPGDSKYEINSSEGREHAQCNAFKSIGDGTSTDAKTIRMERSRSNREQIIQSHAGQRLSLCGSPGTDWSNWPTQSPVCTGDDGLSTRLDGITVPKWRKESIKSGGNAIVPHVAFQIFKTIEAYNEL